MYVAPDVRQLELKVNNKERVWCGWEHFLGGPDNECTARIPPFGQTLVAVADHKDRSHFSAGRTLFLVCVCSRFPEPAPSSALAVRVLSALRCCLAPVHQPATQLCCCAAIMPVAMMRWR